MTTLKYVAVEKDGIKGAILFPAFVRHSDAVNPEQLAKSHSKLLSAGFAQILDGAVTVSGESMSLGVSSKPQDAIIIQQSLFFMGLTKK